MTETILKRADSISRNETGFPDYLDFRKLREKGIEYLGKLSGHIWTDHNVHDPGITTLEMLIYAVMDLGYRTNLPIGDILALPPDKSADFQKNFFGPSEILTCNPTTILDYRKLIMDTEGVRNAWLYDIADVENDNNLLRGIYQVYIDLEVENPDNATKADIIKTVREKLTSHRNLCEDFANEIKILCKQQVGVKTSIELDENQDVEELYVRVVTALRNAVTPTPVYYTLQQLLSKNKRIEDIYAGRPRDLENSYGFVDTEELENIRLKKELHSSDLLNIVAKIPGVKRIDHMSFDSCSYASREVQGKFRLQKDHVAEFDITCSDIRFTRNGIDISFDKDKYLPLFNLNFSNYGKVLYTSPSPYLEPEIPVSGYRTDLGDYYSIQNEFPNVYGIAEGGLPDDASDRRRAQAMQLKAYLLFYDQFLANYLAQLVNIRALFSLSARSVPTASYFAHPLQTVPEFEKLIKLNVGSTGPVLPGEGERTLVFPVSRSDLMEKKAEGKLDQLDLKKQDPWSFKSENACLTAMEQAKMDLRSGKFEVHYISKNENCYFFYLLTSSRDIALLSHSYYPERKSAENDVDALRFTGNLERTSNSYRVSQDNEYSFHLNYRPEGYLETLQQLLESRDGFLLRRQEFLDHLLSRFAEKFTDFAQLSFNFYTEKSLKENEIKAKELFLHNYPQLSSERGKAYDYYKNGWHNTNISGMERRFKSLAGITPVVRRHLNNFELYHHPIYKYVELTIGKKAYFRAPDLYEKQNEAVSAVRQILKAMQNRRNYSSNPASDKDKYELLLQYTTDKQARYSKVFTNEEEAEKEATYLSSLFDNAPVAATSEDIIVASHQYNYHLCDADEVPRLYGEQYFLSIPELNASMISSLGKLDDRLVWKPVTKKTVLPGELKKVRTIGGKTVFIDVSAFKTDINDTIVGKPGMYMFDALDNKNSFKLTSKNDFKTKTQARNAYKSLLPRLAEKESYRIEKVRNEEAYKIVILHKNKIIAENSTTFSTREDAGSMLEKIHEAVRPHIFTISINTEPKTFRYVHYLAKGKDPSLSFVSEEQFESRKEAAAALTASRKSIGKLQVKKLEGNLSITEKKKTKTEVKENIVATCIPLSGQGRTETSVVEREKAALSYLEEQKLIARVILENAKVEEASIHTDERSKMGTVVYQLVDKDNPLASVVHLEKKNKKEILTAENALKYLRRKRAGSYRFLQICLGGDIFRKLEIAKNVFRYHYQVVCKSETNSPESDQVKGLVLFESVVGYQTRSEAEEAFRENYLEILHRAENQINYGEDRYISLTEIRTSYSEGSISRNPVVFIPAETQDYLKELREIPVRKIIALARTYPIQHIKDEQDIRRYFFRLPISYFDLDKWVSIKLYDSVKEATKAFQFFLILLEYPLNIVYEANDTCHNRIIIREVVLSSAKRWDENKVSDAWGREGVERLIAVSQSSDTFHRFHVDPCYRFFVACNSYRMFHPYKYRTAEEREKIKEHLVKVAASFNKVHEEMINSLPLPPVKKDNDQLVKPSFKLNINNKETDKSLDIIELFHDIRKKEPGIAAQEIQYVREQGDKVRVIPQGEYKGRMEAFNLHLVKMAHIFPVVKEEKSGKGQKPAYKISINVPGMDHPDSTWQPEGPCGDVIPWESCPPVWESACRFSTFEEAWEAYSQFITVIGNPVHFIDTYDCECASYGIDLYPFAVIPSGDVVQPPAVIAREEILAYSPQCYKSAEQACEAVERAKRLINSEGLHLIEHILLRDTDDLIKPGPVPLDLSDCEFTWYVENEDPCMQKKSSLFEPGKDPYSFIATAILPAWAGRFRTRANQRLIEHMLNKEMPAHILLRILWLRPAHMYRIEEEYKKWLRFKSRKEPCAQMYRNQNGTLFRFLTQEHYPLYEETAVCPPCHEGHFMPPKYRGGTKLTSAFTDQVHYAYNWHLPKVSTEERNNFFNARLAAYENKFENISERSGATELIKRVDSLLSENPPESASLIEKTDILAEMIGPANGKKSYLAREEATEVAETLIGYYLDKVVSEHGPGLDLKKLEASVKWQDLKKSFRNLERKGIDIREILDRWRNGAIVDFYSAHDINRLTKRLF